MNEPISKGRKALAMMTELEVEIKPLYTWIVY